ncbi:MAG: lactate racemase domain-containing protein [Planctomycetaceae bacterium]|nr:lactate racemase domain-containing protein [Planctomycetaceae bacterium]
MIYSECKNPGVAISEAEVGEILSRGFDKKELSGKKVLVLIPDNTRTCPMPVMFRKMVETLSPVVAKLDFLIALGTHQPIPEAAINKMLGLTETERATTYQNIGIYNHHWENPETFATLGALSEATIFEATGGLMRENVEIGVNRLVCDYDVNMILGPTYPHEVVGVSGGLKYFFPGISNFGFINFFHWLGAVITCFDVIGKKETPVRRVINEAAKLLPRPVVNVNMVVNEGTLVGLFVGDAFESWSKAADLSSKCHIVYKEKPYKLVIGIAPEMYDELWTAGKVMYKLEPVVADGGELIIYAPHITEISRTHGNFIEKTGYHVRDYFLKQWDRFSSVPGGVLAHSTHVRGLGTYENGIEKPRITVTLATGISKEKTEQVALHYRDWRSMNIDSYRNREHEGILVVDHAGEVLHRVR